MSNEMKDWLIENNNETAALRSVVRNHAEYAQQQSGREYMFAALYGSQNYGLATPESDVDTKVWLMPSYTDLALAAKPYSKELHFDEAHVEGKDYRAMIGELKKQNMNFLETIFTPYVVVQPRWWFFYDALHKHREKIARIDVNRGAKAFQGHMFNMYNRLLRDNNPKYAAHLMRLHDCLQRYALTDEPYEELLFNPSNPDYLQAIRHNEFPIEEMKEMAVTLMARAENILNEIPQHKVNKEVEEYLTVIAARALREKFNVRE